VRDIADDVENASGHAARIVEKISGTKAITAAHVVEVADPLVRGLNTSRRRTLAGFTRDQGPNRLLWEQEGLLFWKKKKQKTFGQFGFGTPG
jgi:hypothetical protein